MQTYIKYWCSDKSQRKEQLDITWIHLAQDKSYGNKFSDTIKGKKIFLSAEDILFSHESSSSRRQFKLDRQLHNVYFVLSPHGISHGKIITQKVHIVPEFRPSFYPAVNFIEQARHTNVKCSSTSFLVYQYHRQNMYTHPQVLQIPITMCTFRILVFGIFLW